MEQPRTVFERMTNPTDGDQNAAQRLGSVAGADIRLFLDKLFTALTSVRNDLTVERIPNGWTITVK